MAYDSNLDGFDDLLTLRSDIQWMPGVQGVIELYLSNAGTLGASPASSAGVADPYRLIGNLAVLGRRSEFGEWDVAANVSNSGAMSAGITVFRTAATIQAMPVASRYTSRAASLLGGSIASW